MIAVRTRFGLSVAEKWDEFFPFGAQKDYSHESQCGSLPQTPHRRKLELTVGIALGNIWNH
jgi:hypothetical protein